MQRCRGLKTSSLWASSSRLVEELGPIGRDALLDRVPKLGYMAAYAKQALRDKLIEHKQYITRHGDDMPEVKDWRWPAARA